MDGKAYFTFGEQQDVHGSFYGAFWCLAAQKIIRDISFESEIHDIYNPKHSEGGGDQSVREDEIADDEFDDFGRRKKKYRKELQTPAGPKYKAEQEEEEEDEDDDEDDDDDDDLSKYDLWGNEEAGTKEETQPSKPKSNSPKRSRSKSRSRNRNKRSRRCDFYDT